MANRSMVHARGSNAALSNPDLLQKNLRLLNLDEEFDWPGLTGSTFSATDSVKNLSHRLYTASWIMYKLFDLFEPIVTKKDLGDLFPPLEAKQSSSLRAAIFKRFYDLKLKGFFGKDVVVRKPMFDDCKGPKFEELLAVFSSAVLIRVIEKDKSDHSIVKRNLNRTNLELDMACLNLAYKVSLAQQLRVREAYQRRLNRFTGTLDAQREALEQQASQAKIETSSIGFKRIPLRTLSRLTSLLRENWDGDEEWVDILVSGDRHRPEGRLLETSYTKVWQHACNDTLYVLRPQKKESKMQVLEQRINEQRFRLDRWKNMHAAVVTGKANRQTEMERHSANAVKKYSLRSHSGNLAASLQQNTGREPISQASDDLMSSRKPPTRDTRHRRSRSALPEIVVSKTLVQDQPVIFKKPVANTGIRLSSSSGLKRHIVPKQTIEVTEEKFLYGPEACDDSAEEISDTFVQNIVAEAVRDPASNTEPSPYKTSLTLAERTRISMATGQTRQESISARPNHGSYIYQENVPPTPITELGNLAERRRQSMAVKEPVSIQPVRQARSRPSAVYPINQFETPRKTNIADTSFFDETAINLDEADIFKSRPRVALSPVLSPMQEIEMPDIGLVMDDDDDDEDDFS